MQSVRATRIGWNDGVAAAVLHAITWGVNEGDHIACNTSDVRPVVAGKRPGLDGVVPG